jgi:hypothetical protein
MTDDNVFDDSARAIPNVSLPGSPFFEPRSDLIGHVWKEGKCTGCNLPMSEVSTFVCPAQMCDPEPIPISSPDIESALLALVRALQKGAVPGNASAEYQAARRALGIP